MQAMEQASMVKAAMIGGQLKPEMMVTAFANQLAGEFHLIVAPEDDMPSMETFEDIDAVRTRLQELDGQRVMVWAFAGFRMKITNPPFRYLMTPVGQLPLFDMPDNPEDEESDPWLADGAPVALEEGEEVEAEEEPETPAEEEQE
jgi:hypothetical protein